MLSVEYRRVFHAAHFGPGQAGDLDEWTLRGSDWSPGQPRPALIPAAGEYHHGFIDKDGTQSWVWLAPVRSPIGSSCARCATSGAV